jgi:hypothetical protein
VEGLGEEFNEKSVGTFVKNNRQEMAAEGNVPPFISDLLNGKSLSLERGALVISSKEATPSHLQ